MIARISWKFQLQSSLFKVLRRDCQKFLVCKFLWFSSQGLLSIYFQVSKGLLVYRFCKDRIIPTPPPSQRHTKKMRPCLVQWSYLTMSWLLLQSAGTACSIHILCCAAMPTSPVCHVEKPWPHTLRSLYLWYW